MKRSNRDVNDDMLCCKICHQDFDSLTAIATHISLCHKMKSRDYYDTYIKTPDEGHCLWCGKLTNYRGWQYGKYCGTKCKNSHYYSISENLEKHRTSSYGSSTRKKMSDAAKKRNTDEYRAHLSKQVKKYYAETPNARNLTSLKTAAAIKAGKIRKTYTYDGESFQSYHEVCFYVYLKDHHIRFTHLSDITIEYEYDGIKHHYFPDFKVFDSYVEIKGAHFFRDGKMINPFDRTQDALYEAKHQCMIKHGVKIITDVSNYVEYVNKTYGIDFKEKVLQQQKK